MGWGGRPCSAGLFHSAYPAGIESVPQPVRPPGRRRSLAPHLLVADARDRPARPGQARVPPGAASGERQDDTGCAWPARLLSIAARRAGRSGTRCLVTGAWDLAAPGGARHRSQPSVPAGIESDAFQAFPRDPFYAPGGGG